MKQMHYHQSKYDVCALSKFTVSTAGSSELHTRFSFLFFLSNMQFTFRAGSIPDFQSRQGRRTDSKRRQRDDTWTRGRGVDTCMSRVRRENSRPKTERDQLCEQATLYGQSWWRNARMDEQNACHVTFLHPTALELWQLISGGGSS